MSLDSWFGASNDLFIISRCEAGRRNSCVRGLTMTDRLHSDGALVHFSERLTNSAAFSTLFREGMDLVEETAAYLDGVGRTEAKALDRAASLTYATESMRLTTRLMQLASWLLLHRAVKEGEMTLIQANREKTKVKLSAADPSPADMLEKLPASLQELIARSMSLQSRVSALDRAPADRQPVGATAQPAQGRVRAVSARTRKQKRPRKAGGVLPSNFGK